MNREVCRDGYSIVNILNEIHSYKIKYKRNPSVLFDFVSSIMLFIDNTSDFLFGYRHLVILEKARRFYQELRNAGANLVFFAEGPVKEFKIPKWLEGVNTRYTNSIDLFDKLNSGEFDYNDYYSQKMPLTVLSDNLLELAKEYGEVYTSLKNECDIDISKFANNSNTIAIFTADTDFLIMPGDWSIWLTTKFRFETFSVLQWNKFILRKNLGLSQEQMPILSTLSGNDLIPPNVVKHIHHMFNDKRKLYLSLANFINHVFPDGLPLSQPKYNEMVELLSNTDIEGIDKKDIEELIRESIAFYNIDCWDIPEIEPIWLKRNIHQTQSIIVYQILNNMPITIKQNYIDLRRENSKSFADICLPLVLNQMGIILYHNRQNVERVVYLKPSHDEPFEARFVTPIYPNFTIPKLSDILDGTNISNNKKYQIFQWILKTQYKFENIFELQEDKCYFIPCVSVSYLIQEKQITIDEADVLLMSIGEAVKLAHQGNLNSISAPAKIDSRAFWIAIVYNHLYYFIRNSAIVAGIYSDIGKYNFFDGYIFHKMYPIYLKLSVNEKHQKLLCIEKYRLYKSYLFDFYFKIPTIPFLVLR